jgi:sugar lactone lactonase YvrE
MTESVEVVVDNADRCGEGPVWDHRIERLVWTDLSSGIYYSHDPRTGQTDVISRGIVGGGTALHASGGYLIAGTEGMHRIDAAGNAQTILVEHRGEKLVFNDIIADSRGRIYAGTYYWGEELIKPGTLYLIGADRAPRAVADGIELSNGLGLSPDDRTLYYADSTARTIYAFDVDLPSGELSNRRTFVRIPPDEGLPDGLTVDAAGFVWNALWYGSQVVRYDPDGKVERRIRTPAKQTSSLAFGGAELTDLYITSAAEPWPSPFMPKDYDPASGNVGGALYRVRLADVEGRPENEATI